MDSKQLIKKIEEMHYWDARVISLSTDFFGDELVLVYEDSDGDVVYKFLNCYQVNYKHALDYDKEKPISDFTRLQLPYFLQNIELEDYFNEDKKYLKCTITMPPLEVSILSKEFVIYRK
ncbi:hypothetical protein ACFP56_08965 [Paenibacillus septentrionalis]|uniref:Uncharacterized protein n=1 Tax=Paenibacillus septentrionalis TaxID=429342 RepID=A0ABW1V1S8_9BACL